MNGAAVIALIGICLCNLTATVCLAFYAGRYAQKVDGLERDMMLIKKTLYHEGAI